MRRSSPPRWMEAILLLVLPLRDRDAVAGDLHEEYCASKLPASGRVRADLWYALHVLSFLPHHAAAMFARAPGLVLVSGFTALYGLWFAAMGLRLRHPDYMQSELIAATIVLEALLIVSALCFRPVALLRRIALTGTLATVGLAAKALIAAIRGVNVEGYILLIALFLLVQAALTVRWLPDWSVRRM